MPDDTKARFAQLEAQVPQEVRALRIVRALDEGFHYDKPIVPSDGREGCLLYLKRLDLLGFLTPDAEAGQEFVIDLLDSRGDIVGDFPISPRGAHFLAQLIREENKLTGLGGI